MLPPPLLLLLLLLLLPPLALAACWGAAGGRGSRKITVLPSRSRQRYPTAPRPTQLGGSAPTPTTPSGP